MEGVGLGLGLGVGLGFVDGGGGGWRLWMLAGSEETYRRRSRCLGSSETPLVKI